MATLYYHKHGGKVLAICPAGPDLQFERHLDKQGLEWATMDVQDTGHVNVHGNPTLPHEYHKVVDADGDGIPEQIQEYRGGL